MFMGGKYYFVVTVPLEDSVKLKMLLMRPSLRVKEHTSEFQNVHIFQNIHIIYIHIIYNI